MKWQISDLIASLAMAAAMLAATALAEAAPSAPWTAFAAPLLLVLALLGCDAALRRRAGGGVWPSASAATVAGILLVACGVLGFRSYRPLAEVMPVFGCCAALPVVLRVEGRRSSCGGA